LTVPDLIVERDEGVVVATLNRPARRNALSRPLFDALAALFEEVDRRDEDRVLVLTGAGGTFCSGADLTAPDDDGPPAGSTEALERIHRCALALHRCATPTVAAVDGLAVGAGMSLALGCDLVVATDRAQLCAIFVRRALSIDFGLSWLLPRLVGTSRAKAIALLGEPIGAAQALELGLVHLVVPPDALLDEATALARRLASGPRLAIRADLDLLDGSWGRDFAEALQAEVRAQAANVRTADVAEAMAAFVEKREPRFTGA
jgi:enoyl-CoA hydratase/carnithine racemase